MIKLLENTFFFYNNIYIQWTHLNLYITKCLEKSFNIRKKFNTKQLQNLQIRQNNMNEAHILFANF